MQVRNHNNAPKCEDAAIQSQGERLIAMPEIQGQFTSLIVVSFCFGFRSPMLFKTALTRAMGVYIVMFDSIGYNSSYGGCDVYNQFKALLRL